jgi:hypothetical protein
MRPSPKASTIQCFPRLIPPGADREDLISADMEGTTGVSSWVQVIAPETADSDWPSNQTEYERARLR